MENLVTEGCMCSESTKELRIAESEAQSQQLLLIDEWAGKIEMALTELREWQKKNEVATGFAIDASIVWAEGIQRQAKILDKNLKEKIGA